MGWLENAAGMVDKIGDRIENSVEDGLESAGQAIDSGLDALAGAANRIGADGVAGALTTLSDSVASITGGQVDELELGQTDQPKELIRGDTSAIFGAVDTLTALTAGIESTATSLRQIDAADWTGTGADAFNEVYDKQPGLWFEAADAMIGAGSTLTSWSYAVEGLQAQAADAIALWKEAARVEQSQIDAFNALTGEQQHANPLTDTWTPMREEARRILADARSNRDYIAGQVVGELEQATAAAPTEPPFTERMIDNLTDIAEGSNLAAANFSAGLVGSVTGIVAFVRQVSIVDPYNISHPAEYFAGMSDTVAGVTAAAANPGAAVSAMFTGIAKNPFEFAGSLAGDAILTAATGGAGGAAVLGRNGIRIADELSELGAAGRTLDDIPTRPSAHGEPPSDGSHPDTPGPRERSEGDRGIGEDAADSGPNCDRTQQEVCSGRDPVDIATGEFLLPETDLALPAVLPFILTRRHRSNYRRGRWFGNTWTSTLDMRVVVEESGVSFVAEDGVLLAYPHSEPGIPVMPISGQRWPLTRTAAGGYRIENPERAIIWHFAPERAAAGLDIEVGNFAISAITDQHKNRIRFHYNTSGEPTEIVHSGGYRILVDTTAGRVAALSVASRDQNTTVRRFSYRDGNLAAVTTGTGATTSYTYDADGRMTSWTDSNGNRMLNTYDTFGRVTEQHGTGGVLDSSFHYADMADSAGSVTTVTDSVGAVTVHGFDSDLRLRDLVTPIGAHTHTDYNARRDPLAVTAPDGTVTRYRYTADGDIARITRPDGHPIIVEYVAARKPSAIRTPGGASAHRTWDPSSGNLIAFADTTGARTECTYRSDGAPASILSPSGARTEIECDKTGLPISVTDPLGLVTSIARDGFGRIISVTDPTGATVHYQWGVDGKLLAQVDPDGSTQRWNYDGEGNLLRSVDALGAETHYTYGDFDLLVSQCDPDGSVTTYTWDTERRLASVINPMGGVWTYRYDPAGRLIEESDFNDATTEYAYDSMDHIVEVTPPTGVVRRHTYDVLGQLSSVDTDAGESRAFERDLAGRPVVATTAQHGNPIHRLAYEYTLDGLPTGQSLDNHPPMTFDYDIERRLTSRTSPGGHSTGWQWDLAGRPRSLVADGNPISFSHDARGQLTAWNVHELAVTRIHTVAGQLAAQQVTAHPATLLNMDFGPTSRPEPTILRRDEYRYRDDRYLTGHTINARDVDTVDRVYALDPVGRITTVDSAETTEHFTYDALGNIRADESARREYRGTLLIRDGRHRYTYDSAGRLIRTVTTRLSRKPDVWHYRYDGFDQLAEVTTPDGSIWRYTYDALGRRTTKTHHDQVGAVAEQTFFTWDGTTLIEQSSTREALRWTYLPGTHTPLTQATNTEFYAIVTDLIGTPTDLVDPVTGIVAGSAKQSLWGVTSWRGEVSTPLRFPGQYADTETGLHYNLHRYYNPHTARFITPDPLGLAPAPNPDAYVHNPTGWIDPFGLTPCQPESVQGPNGEKLPVVAPGTTGSPTWNGKGIEYPVAPGTPGLDHRVVSVRVMDPVSNRVADYPNGYVVYQNAGGQTVNPVTGRTTIGKHDPYGHIPLPPG
ncbi:putative T7SS-secreted protein [Rhodococcus sp. OK302]|uniref:putative T7SS-secreted protein n=1 Tax=Rhodococcus sp. OK302 TaxID=1882769 RepID=UPI000B93D1E2|nr:RHS repeat-associated core domain-containing protein [Rhodococcus sp. OK302]OYD71380.1 RHS repeat-associated protein [Rhodococcus sp. OK302]